MGIMRTTIEIPRALRQKLVGEASRRNIKGYSAIITEALEFFFDSKERTGEPGRKKIVNSLAGSLSAGEYNEEMKRIKSARQNWRKK